MSEASFASLGPTLLARKGGAKPAMRPQLTPLVRSPEEMAALADEQLEDLGWNDMGDDRREEGRDDGGDDRPEDRSRQRENPGKGADVVPISPPRSPEAANEDDGRPATRSPVVRRQQKQLLDRVLAEAAMDGSEGELGEDEEDLSAFYFGQPGAGTGAPSGPEHKRPAASRKPAPNRSAAKSAGAKRAAFTLRLDTERHLKLRLAATMQGVSAQALVTEALDAMLAEIEDLDALVARMRRD